MKKTFLTLFTLGLSISFSFAQTKTEVNEELVYGQDVEMERMVAQDHVGRTAMELDMLPIVVREAYLSGAYADMELLAVYKLATEIGTEPVIYEFELLEPSGVMSVTAFGGLEIERVSYVLPDLVIQVNEDGEIVKEKEPDEVEE